MRLELILLISEFGLSCYNAAKVLDLSYPNAKAIYRIFRADNRVFSKARTFETKLQNDADGHLLKNSQVTRANVLRKLIQALKDDTFENNFKRSEICQRNFHEIFA